MSSKRQRKAAIRKYVALEDTSVVAEEKGEWRICADKSLEAFFSAPAKRYVGRWDCFYTYTKMVGNYGKYNLRATQDDIMVLKKLSKDEEEPVVFRVQALQVLGFFRMNMYRDERAASYFRKALHLVQAKLNPLDPEYEVGAHGPLVSEPVSLRDLAGELAVAIDGYLTMLEDPTSDRFYRMEGVPMVNGKPDLYFARRLALGSGACDCCEKKRSAEVELMRCMRCKKNYYCSNECQEKQWFVGHKKACHEYGVFKVGDYVTLICECECCEDSEHGALARIIQCLDGGLCEVSIEGRKSTLTVAESKLSHIRPEK